MQDRPTALELLAAVREFLEADVVPALGGRRRFHALVAANVLGIVERELRSEEEALAAEWRRLAALLGDEGPAPAGTAALRAAVRGLTAALADRIRAGEADAGPFAAAVRAHVRWAVVEKLRVAKGG
ncbi:MAG TPA: DUF6285 domain-containing protein [Candidatus Binatia bacterium]|nr:DUF6285 domain-containing protein [Candidatus Binatia bacterium]